MIAASEIARQLGGRKHGSYWTARCPAHDDKNPSLSIKDGDNGQPVFRCHAGCSQSQVLDALRGRGLWPDNGQPRDHPAIKPRPADRPADTDRIASARRIWRESLDPRASCAEHYLAERGLRLPSDPEILLRTLRYHPACPFPDGAKCPALICAFTPIWTAVPDDPFDDPPPTAVHRIRGKGHANKFMLGPTKGCAVMISPTWHVHEHLHVAEGVETALALYAEGSDPGGDDDPDARQYDGKARRSIWSLGSSGGIARLPVIARVRRLVIWADNDTSGTGLAAARACAVRWAASGKRVVIRQLTRKGADYADR